jgi:hypothetical protein
VYKLFVVIDNDILSERGGGCEIVVNDLTIRVSDSEEDISPIGSPGLVEGSPGGITRHLQSGFRGLGEPHMGFTAAVVDELVTDLEHN